MALQESLAPATERLQRLLSYVEQVVRLDERPAFRLSEYTLPNGSPFVLHQHEVHNLPGVRHDLFDDEGPIWLSVERLRRGEPPVPPEELADWLEISPDPNRQPELREFLIRTISQPEKDALLASGAARPENCAET